MHSPTAMTMGLFNKLRRQPSTDSFARQALAGIRRAGEPRPIEYDREQYRVFLPDQDGGILNLANGYYEFCSVPRAARDEIVQKWVRHWFVSGKDLPEAFEDVHPDLLPTVRARSYFDLTRLGMELRGDTGSNWPYQIIGDHLAVGLVCDMPESMRSIIQDDLDKWDVTFYEALEAARQNLVQMQHAFIGPKEGEGVYLSMTGDNYDASRLLLLDRIRDFNVKGDHVAMLPNRDTLLVTGTDDVDGLKGMLALAEEPLQGPRLITGLAFRLDEEDWVPWLPAPDHPQYSQFRLLQVQSLVQDYEEQEQLLDSLHEKRGEDVFVANYTGMRNEQTGEVTSYAVWPNGVHTLLPQVDTVAFMRQPVDQPLWSVELSARIVADQHRVATSLLETPTTGFTVWDVRGYWQATERLLLIAGFENFTDEHYREHLDFRSENGIAVYQPGISFYIGGELTY